MAAWVAEIEIHHEACLSYSSDHEVPPNTTFIVKIDPVPEWIEMWDQAYHYEYRGDFEKRVWGYLNFSDMGPWCCCGSGLVRIEVKKVYKSDEKFLRARKAHGHQLYKRSGNTHKTLAEPRE